MKTVTVGIFWIIKGKAYAKKQEKEIETERLKKLVEISDKIDSDFQHFAEWDELCARRFPYADFATYPRGRVMFDIKKNGYFIYADECISPTELKEIAKIFGVGDNYSVARDEHYSCDKCISRKNLF